MKIETKFDIEDRVCFLYDNKVVESFIDKIVITKIKGKDPTINYHFFDLSPDPVVIQEERVFNTKQKLLNSL